MAVTYWSERGHDGGHRECEAVNPSSGVVPVGRKRSFFPVPPEMLNVIHLMFAEQSAKRLDELYRDVLVEQKLHRTIKRRAARDTRRRIAQTRALPERPSR